MSLFDAVFLLKNLVKLHVANCWYPPLRVLPPPQNHCYFLHFHAIFGEIWPNNSLVLSIWEILNPPLQMKPLNIIEVFKRWPGEQII